jgi:hypothetical protein
VRFVVLVVKSLITICGDQLIEDIHNYGYVISVMLI